MASSTSARTAMQRLASLPTRCPHHQLALRIAAKGQVRHYAKEYGQKAKREKEVAAQKKRKAQLEFKQYDLKDADQFSLQEAMRYIKAFEVGYPETSCKYDMAIKLKTHRSGATIKNRLVLPHPVATNLRICVICPPHSKAAEEAIAAGAVLVGEDEVFEQVQNGIINFDRCLAHPDSVEKMFKARMPRLLGGKGLLPSGKTKTILKNVGQGVLEMTASVTYRERMGVVRLPIGHVGFTADELRRNMKAVIDSVRKDFGEIADKTEKSIKEIVLSATHSPGFSLNGAFKNLPKDAPVV